MGLCKRFAEHTWGKWSEWTASGNGKYETRERECKVCHETETDSRLVK
jgi:hypothetical protein